MRQQLRVLSTALALKEFTVARLAEVAGVNVSTARTVISREPDTFELAGVERTGKPGGQLRMYRVNPAAVDKVRERLRGVAVIAGIEDTLDAGMLGEVPATLIVAHNLLGPRWQQATKTADRHELLSSARAALEAARADFERSRHKANSRQVLVYETHMNAVRARYAFAETTVTGKLEQLSPQALFRFYADLIRNAQELARIGHHEHASSFLATGKELQDAICRQVEQDPALIDGIPEKADALTSRVRTVLLTRFGVKRIKYFDISGSKLNSRSQCRFGETLAPLIVTWDSRNAGVTRLKEIFANRRSGGGFCVFDANYSAATSKVVAQHNGLYYPGALKFDEEAIANALTRSTSFVGDCSLFGQPWKK